MPASSGTRYGNGAGWGGPAKGAGSAAPSFTTGAGEPTREKGPGPGRGHISEATAAKRAADAERGEEMRRVLRDIAVAGRSEMARVQAAQALLNRIEGMPVQANLNVNSDDLSHLTDDELRAELARISAEADRGDAEAEGQSELPGVRQ